MWKILDAMNYNRRVMNNIDIIYNFFLFLILTFTVDISKILSEPVIWLSIFFSI